MEMTENAKLNLMVSQSSLWFFIQQNVLKICNEIGGLLHFRLIKLSLCSSHRTQNFHFFRMSSESAFDLHIFLIIDVHLFYVLSWCHSLSKNNRQFQASSDVSWTISYCFSLSPLALLSHIDEASSEQPEIDYQSNRDLNIRSISMHTYKWRPHNTTSLTIQLA
jgi:hypothetical protein